MMRNDNGYSIGMIMRRLGIAAGLILISTQIAGANFQNGQNAFSQNKVEEAVREWRTVADYGHGQAQLRLGKLYEKGAEGLDANLVEAYAWFKLAAAQEVAEAEAGLQRIIPNMTAGQIEAGNSQAVAALGVWYRKQVGQDEAAFQQAKAEANLQKQQQQAAESDGAKQRAEKQRALIAERNAKAKKVARLHEENRQMAILAAQQQAEEAKQKALLMQQRVEEEKQLAALKVNQQQQSELDAARARLEELKAKQRGETNPGPSSSKVTAIPTSSRVISSTEAMPSANEATVPAVAAVPRSSVIQQVTLAPEPAPVKPGGNTVHLQEAKLTEKKIVIASTDTVQTDATKEIVSLPIENMTGLDEAVVLEIFENARTVELDTEAAQTEITETLVRIDALKWSLISGAQGDKAAPKMNKILMSRMSPVQIAEANRLAGEWIVDRQKRL